MNSTVAISANAHRQAGMTGIGLLDGIHGKEADGVGHPVVLGALVMVARKGSGWMQCL